MKYIPLLIENSGQPAWKVHAIKERIEELEPAGAGELR
jgi:hypothetical protein